MQLNQVYTLDKQCIEYMLGDKKQVCGNQYLYQKIYSKLSLLTLHKISELGKKKILK
jgi:hypothetical protein